MYRNESKEEMLAFTGAYLMAACMKHSDENVYKLYNKQVVADANERIIAEKNLFAEIVSMIADHTLVTTLATLHVGKGTDALQAVKDQWEDGDADNRESNAHDTYYGTLYPCTLTADLSPEEFATKCNLLHTARTELATTDRRVTNEAHACNLRDWVSKIDAEYKSDVKFAFMDKTPDQRKDHQLVQKTLTTLIRARSSKPKTESEIKTLKTTPHESERKFEKKKCPKCGDVHWVNVKNPDNCMTYMRACGKTPDRWEEKPEDLRKSIEAKAQVLKEKLK